MDIKTERRHYLNVPMVTRYIRIHPLTWRKRIGLRAGAIGCHHSGECGPGFLRVNSKAGCGMLQHFDTWQLVYSKTSALFQFPTKLSKDPPGSMTRGTPGNSGSMATAPWQWMARRTPTCQTVPSWTTTTWTSQSSWWTSAPRSGSMVLLSSPGRVRDKVI